MYLKEVNNKIRALRVYRKQLQDDGVEKNEKRIEFVNRKIQALIDYRSVLKEEKEHKRSK